MPTGVVTISHATGSGGGGVGRVVAGRLGFRYIDEEIIAVAAEKQGLDPAVVADAERRKTFLAQLFSALAEGPALDAIIVGGGTAVSEAVTMTRSDDLRRLIIAAIHDTAERGQVVIVSHAASIPLAGRADVLRVLVTASFDTRVQRVARDAQHGTTGAARFVTDGDAARADYFKRFYQIDRELPTHYDLVINTDALSGDEAADIVVAAARRRA
jgi:cytidylate kinase